MHTHLCFYKSSKSIPHTLCVCRIEKGDGFYTLVYTQDGDAMEHRLDVSAVFMATGRTPRTSNLGLEVGVLGCGDEEYGRGVDACLCLALQCEHRYTPPLTVHCPTHPPLVHHTHSLLV